MSRILFFVFAFQCTNYIGLTISDTRVEDSVVKFESMLLSMSQRIEYLEKDNSTNLRMDAMEEENAKLLRENVKIKNQMHKIMEVNSMVFILTVHFFYFYTCDHPKINRMYISNIYE